MNDGLLDATLESNSRLKARLEVTQGALARALGEIERLRAEVRTKTQIIDEQHERIDLELGEIEQLRERCDRLKTALIVLDLNGEQFERIVEKAVRAAKAEEKSNG